MSSTVATSLSFTDSAGHALPLSAAILLEHGSLLPLSGRPRTHPRLSNHPPTGSGLDCVERHVVEITYHIHERIVARTCQILPENCTSDQAW